MKLLIPAGATSWIDDIFVQDSSVTTGAGLTGLLFNSAGLTWYYKRQGDASWTAVTLATQTVGTWASGGFIESDATHAPGMYEIGIPNAVLAAAAGVHSVAMFLKGAANMVPVPIQIEFVGQANELPFLGANVGPMSISNGVTFSNSTGSAFTCSSSGNNGGGIVASGNGSGDGIKATGGATGAGLHGIGGATSGAGLVAAGSAGNANGATFTKNGTGQDIAVQLQPTSLDLIVMSDLTAVPAITGSLKAAINWLFCLARNKRTQTATTETLFKTDDATSVATSTKSDAAGTFTRGQYS